MTIAEFLTDRGIEHRLPGSHKHVTSRFIGIDCPRCSPGSSKFKLGLSIRGATCWSCGRMRLGDALAEVTGLSVGECLRAVGGSEDAEAVEKVQGKLKLPFGLRPLLPVHRAYLENRGLDPDQLEREWGFRGIGPHAKLAWRVFIPITLKGKTVSWTTRSIIDRGLRYLTATVEDSDVNPKDVLFGSDKAKHAIVICEGPLDAVKIGPGGAATLGVGSVSRPQLLEMARFPSRAICFDMEPDAQRRANELADALAPFPGETTLVELETGKDAGECSKKELKQIRRRFLQ